jgi:hypothetical protein
MDANLTSMAGRSACATVKAKIDPSYSPNENMSWKLNLHRDATVWMLASLIQARICHADVSLKIQCMSAETAVLNASRIRIWFAVKMFFFILRKNYLSSQVDVASTF